jgi:hypothetical protein
MSLFYGINISITSCIFKNTSAANFAAISNQHGFNITFSKLFFSNTISKLGNGGAIGI